MFGVGEDALVGTVGDVPQAEMIKHSSINEENFRMLDSVSDVSRFTI